MEKLPANELARIIEDWAGKNYGVKIQIYGQLPAGWYTLGQVPKHTVIRLIKMNGNRVNNFSKGRETNGQDATKKDAEVLDSGMG